MALLRVSQPQRPRKLRSSPKRHGWDDEHFAAFWAVDNSTAEDRKCLDFGTDGKGVAMGMFKTGDAPTLASNKYLLFGKVSVTMQAAKGAGLITAMVLKSDSGDEIDWV
ncbi:hypothetical protein E4U35_005664 [Claviceps purpurea]|nr:hypothetical protein E4U11_005072 [Claviceps purpurea]KAG6210225.1 hypothetical protein E4U35_005664 [Claviceps purpurea]KAG6287743.1 hypothetical protein E4U46_003843 [Claviceps purpurea]